MPVSPAPDGAARRGLTAVQGRLADASTAPRFASPGSIPRWQVTAARAFATATLAVLFGIVLQWPLRSDPMLLAANLAVSVGFASGSVLISDDSRHAGTRRAFLAASLLWSVAWVNAWQVPVLNGLAALVGPLPELLAIWGLLRFPRPWRTRRAATRLVSLLVSIQLVGMAAVITGAVPSLRPGIVHASLAALYDDGGALCAALLGGLFVARTAKLHGHELRITVPIAIAVAAGAVATSLSDAAAGLGNAPPTLRSIYVVEGVLLALIPASFIASYLLRRFSIEGLAGRVGPYDSVAQTEAALRRALRDPTLRIQVALSEGRWQDIDGRNVAVPPASDRLYLPVIGGDGQQAAVVSIDSSLERFRDLLAGAVQSLHLVVENARLLAQLRQDIAVVQQSAQRIARASAAERRLIRQRTVVGPLRQVRIAHDTLEAAVTALADAGSVPKPLVDARAMVMQAAADLEQLSLEGAPIALDAGLADAIGRSLEGHESVHLQVETTHAAAAVERVGYFLVLEAVGNATKHAGPGARIDVVVIGGEPGIRIAVLDNGRGGAEPSGHGLLRMAEQVASVGGTLRIVSEAGAGTRVFAELPNEPIGRPEHA